ncbi:MAG: histidine phosphatase family protein [Actinobacteria bacterium]|nr:histidine phosphatase family protein [Actinomycetota bacterium]
MERVILARHAESELSVRGALNGDPRARGGALTATGRRQAEALGTLLADDPIDLCATSEFARTRETADLALAGREVPRLTLPELNDIRFGSFEGKLLDDYRAWALSSGPGADCPGGGESRVDAAARYAAAYRALLARSEPTVFVVTHALPIRYLLSALVEQDPAARVEPVPYAEPYRFSAPQLERAARRLERWCRTPAFA